MEAEYRISIEGPTAQTFIVTLSKVNIDPKGYHVADFKGRNLPALIAKANAWITNDATHPEPWCRHCDRPQDDCMCQAVQS